MTSELKCPVCGEPLGILLCDVDDFVCKKCRMTGDEKLWQALIQAKQDLEIAVDALNTITATPLNSRVIHDAANKALEQIEHKE